MKKPVALFFLFFTFLPVLLWASPPVPYSGKVAINGVNYFGQAKFAFAIHDANGTVHWRNGETANDTISVNVANGRYVVHLGGQGMNPLPASLFAGHVELYVGVRFDIGDGKGLRNLAPDQRITAVPYAKVAEMVKLGAVTAAQLNDQILKYLKPEVNLPFVDYGPVVPEQPFSLQSNAEGKYLSYQWYKNGQLIVGATGDRYFVDAAKKVQHDGNYSIVVRNEFGSVQSPLLRVNVGNHLVDLNASLALEMIWCSPGVFLMGSAETEYGRSNDEDEHNVTLTKGFFLGKYEVTQAQYEAVMLENTDGLNPFPSGPLRNTNLPVTNVSWNDVQVFINRLNAVEQRAGRLPAGWKYALPTEAQWEYACRAGTGTVYSWGNDINSSLANYNDSGIGRTLTVGQYSANNWGFYDMHGNAFEWVHDWYGQYNTASPSTDPTGPSISDKKVLRGGSWGNASQGVRSAERRDNPANHSSAFIGFRIAFKPDLGP